VSWLGVGRGCNHGRRRATYFTLTRTGTAGTAQSAQARKPLPICLRRGANLRGIPTSFGALPLSAQISAPLGEAPVWPRAEGQARGPSERLLLLSPARHVTPYIAKVLLYPNCCRPHMGYRHSKARNLNGVTATPVSLELFNTRTKQDI
jgi:hypothetical protein